MNPVERRRTRLRTVSRWGSRLCIAFMVALPVGLVAIWAVEPDVLARGYAADGAPPMPAGIRILQLGVLMLPVALAIAGLRHLAAAFRIFASDTPLSGQSSQSLRRFAGYLVAQAAAAPVTGAALSVLESWMNPPGQRVLALTISSHSAGLALLALLLFAIAWVMAEAAEIAEDHRLIL